MDRIIAGLAGLGLLSAMAATIWFCAGFIETDPGFSAASSAILLSLGLGAFAIIPCAVILRLALTAYRRGFRLAYGLWSLLLALPWIAVGVIAWPADWLPPPLSLLSIGLAVPICLWALASIALDWKRQPRD